MTTVDSANTWFVEAMSARTIAHPLEDDRQFTLRGRSIVHYLWLLLMCVAVITSLATAVFVGTRRDMPKRWLWMLASLFGGGAFTLNWMTGAISFQLLNVLLLSGAVVRAGPASPWGVTFAIPVGALFALRKHRRWRQGVGVTPTQLASPPQLPSG